MKPLTLNLSFVLKLQLINLGLWAAKSEYLDMSSVDLPSCVGVLILCVHCSIHIQLQHVDCTKSVELLREMIHHPLKV